MPTLKKEALIADIQEKSTNATGLFFTDYHGLSVNTLSTLRMKLSELSSEYVITKNTLLKRVHGEVSLEGPTATLFTYTEPVEALKQLTAIAKKLGKPTFKGGLVNGTWLSGDQVIELSKLPGRDVLRGKLVNVLVAPLQQTVSILSANQRNLVYALSEIAKKKTD